MQTFEDDSETQDEQDNNESTESLSVVIDNGSNSIKAGFASEEDARTSLVNAVGHNKDSSNDKNRKKIYFGNEALDNEEFLEITHPIKHRLITSYKNMELLWEYIFYNELRIQPENHCILHAEPPFNSNENRQKLTQVMFETFNFQGLSLYNQQLLSMYCEGNLNGVVFDSGETVTNCVCVSEGALIQEGISRLQLAGSDVTAQLTNMLYSRKDICNLLFTRNNKINFKNFDKRIINNMKEKACYVCENFEKDYGKYEANHENFQDYYELPDGNDIVIDKERFMPCEILFNSNYDNLNENIISNSKNNQNNQNNQNNNNLQSFLYTTIMQCDINPNININDLFNNIVLSGGNTMLTNFDKRLHSELLKIIPKHLKLSNVSIKCPSDGKYSSWRGGSILASLDSFKEKWISQNEYKEYGSNIIFKNV